MGRVRKFLRLPATTRRLLFLVWLRLLWTSLKLRLIPRSRVRRMLLSAPRSDARAKSKPPTVDQVCSAITIAARYVPGATCLVQALVGRDVLHGVGESAEIRLGVAKNDAAIFEAHAWLEGEGRVLLGGSATQY